MTSRAPLTGQDVHRSTATSHALPTSVERNSKFLNLTSMLKFPAYIPILIICLFPEFPAAHDGYRNVGTRQVVNPSFAVFYPVLLLLNFVHFATFLSSVETLPSRSVAVDVAQRHSLCGM